MASSTRMSERRMVALATPLVLAALNLSAERYRVAHELPVGTSIADMVIVRPSARALRPEAPLTAAESVVLSAIRRSGASQFEEIERETYMQRGQLDDVLSGRLMEWRLVDKRRDDVEARTYWVTSSKIIAIEAKLKRWREALQQATNYRQYANKSYVLLPSETAAVAAKDESSFKRAGVGLLSYDGTAVKRLFDADRSEQHSWHREYALSRV